MSTWVDDVRWSTIVPYYYQLASSTIHHLTCYHYFTSSTHVLGNISKSWLKLMTGIQLEAFAPTLPIWRTGPRLPEAPRMSQDVPGRIGHDRSMMTHDHLMSGQVELFWYLQIGLPPVSMIVIVSIATIVGYIILSYPIVGQPIWVLVWMMGDEGNRLFKGPWHAMIWIWDIATWISCPLNHGTTKPTS